MVDGKNYLHFNKKSLSQLSPEEITELYRTTIGQAAKNALDNVIYTYSKLWGQKLTIDQINARLKTYTEDRLTEKPLAKEFLCSLIFTIVRKRQMEEKH